MTYTVQAYFVWPRHGKRLVKVYEALFIVGQLKALSNEINPNPNIFLHCDNVPADFS
jgi:hypothetical protein